MNQQRKTVYALRRRILNCDPVAAAEYNPLLDGELKENAEHKEAADRAMREMVLDLVEEGIVNAVMNHCPEKTNASEWKIDDLQNEINGLMGLTVDLSGVSRNRDELLDACWNAAESKYKDREEQMGKATMRQMEAFLYLQTIDGRWKEHLQQMDQLREGIHMRSYGQKDPKQEYKKDGYKYFKTMMSKVRDEVLTHVFTAEVEKAQSEEELDQLREQRRQAALLQARRDQEKQSRDAAASRRRPAAKQARRVSGPSQSSTPIPGGAGGQEMGLGGQGGESNLNRAQRRRQKSGTKKRKRM